MSIVASNLVGVVIVLGVLIFAHEAGHFVMAKVFGVRVLVFSFGFGKRLFGFRKGDTDYRVSLIPLGGYVRMAGDTPEENTPGDPSEFLSKPKWQRFLILVAGPAMNLIIAITFVASLIMVGTEELVVHPIIGEVIAGKAAARAGLQVGDRITRIDGDAVDKWEDLRMSISMHPGQPVSLDYVRNGSTFHTVLTPDKEDGEYGVVGRASIGPLVEPLVFRTLPGSPADKAGFKPGDRIVGAANQPVHQLYDFEKRFAEAKGKPFPVVLQRGPARISTTFQAALDAPTLGFETRVRLHKLPLVPALGESVQENWKMLKATGSALSRLVRAQGSVKELSGPISIARISGEMFRRGWVAMVALMASISLQLGVMNLLPVPVLDGGHIFILVIEGVARRDLSMRVKERIQQLGFAALAMLMIVVLYNDVISNVMRKG
jgi:regulator of sigma E protease